MRIGGQGFARRGVAAASRFSQPIEPRAYPRHAHVAGHGGGGGREQAGGGTLLDRLRRSFYPSLAPSPPTPRADATRSPSSCYEEQRHFHILRTTQLSWELYHKNSTRYNLTVVICTTILVRLQQTSDKNNNLFIKFSQPAGKIVRKKSYLTPIQFLCKSLRLNKMHVTLFTTHFEKMIQNIINLSCT